MRPTLPPSSHEPVASTTCGLVTSTCCLNKPWTVMYKKSPKDSISTKKDRWQKKNELMSLATVDRLTTTCDAWFLNPSKNPRKESCDVLLTRDRIKRFLHYSKKLVSVPNETSIHLFSRLWNMPPWRLSSAEELTSYLKKKRTSRPNPRISPQFPSASWSCSPILHFP